MNIKNKKPVLYTILFFLCFIIIVPNSTQACKDIIACGDATDGDFNLLLKVRDPSRPDYQVLTIVPKGYTYTYRHPWTGKEMNFEVKHKIIGVVSSGDVIPNIVKPGMCFTDAGLAFGDADTITNWKNPTQNAWDDFDWIRYACQTADNEKEAVSLLTEDAVDKYHATGVPENLFVVGPDEGYVIEADVIHHKTKKVDDFVVMTNYAKELWKKSFIYRSIAKSFDKEFEGTIREKRAIRLGFGSIFGLRVMNVGHDYIEVKQIPISFSKGNIVGRQIKLNSLTRINIGEGKKVGFYYIELNSINNNKADVKVSYEYKAWEDRMNEIIQKEVGSIDVSDMIKWSRLHSSDLDGLRSMCGENPAYNYEGSMIYKIPKKEYDVLSEGWFSPNHACSSIYVPIHICDTEIYDPYETGEVAELSLDLLNFYGHGYLSKFFEKTEQVFLNETDYLKEIIVNEDKENISNFFTLSDNGMQKQGFLTQKMWYTLDEYSNKKQIEKLISNIWEDNYSFSLKKMKENVIELSKLDNHEYFVEEIIDIALDIVKTRIDMAESLGKNINSIIDDYNTGKNFLENDNYEKGFSLIQKSFYDCNNLLQLKMVNIETRPNKGIKASFSPIYFLSLIPIVFLTYMVFKK